MKVIDLNTKPLPGDRFLKYKADILGISVKSLTFHESERMAENIYPDVSKRHDSRCVGQTRYWRYPLDRKKNIHEYPTYW